MLDASTFIRIVGGTAVAPLGGRKNLRVREYASQEGVLNV